MRRRIARFVVLIAAAALYFTLAPRWPRDNVVHFVLGAGAAQVAELEVRYAPASKNGQITEDWTREVTFRFPDGSTPRVVTHEPRLADGDYVVEIEILKSSHARATLQRRVTLEGGTVSIDISQAAQRETDQAPDQNREQHR